MEEIVLESCCINTDCWHEVFKYIYDYKDWCSLTSTCQYLRQFNNYELNKKICIRQIVKISMDKYHPLYNKYNKLNISYTKDFDIDLIIRYLNYKWNWSYISKHINIYYINKYTSLLISLIRWFDVATNKTITSNFVIKYLDYFKYCWYELAQNSNLSIVMSSRGNTVTIIQLFKLMKFNT